MIDANALGLMPDPDKDQTTDVNTLLASVRSNDVVFFGPGIYRVDEIDAAACSVDGVHHWRHDQGGTIFKTVADFQGDAVFNCSNNPSSIRNVGIWAQGAKYGIHAYKAHGHQSLFENVAVSVADNAGFRFEQCQVADMRRLVSRYTSYFENPAELSENQGVGYHISGCNGSEFYRCNSERGRSHGWLVEKGTSSGGVTIRSCEAQICDGDGIRVQGLSDVNGNRIGPVNLMDNWIEGCKGDGIRVDLASAIYMQNNRISKANPATEVRGVRVTNSHNLRSCDNGVESNKQTYRDLSGENLINYRTVGDYRVSGIAPGPLTWMIT